MQRVRKKVDFPNAAESLVPPFKQASNYENYAFDYEEPMWSWRWQEMVANLNDADIRLVVLGERGCAGILKRWIEDKQPAIQRARFASRSKSSKA